MPKWIWVLFALSVSSGIYFSIRYGLQPKPIPQLNPTVFENPEEIGVVTYRALRASLRQERVLVLGSAPALQDYQAIWNGFVKAALADGIKIDHVFEREDLQLPSALSASHVRIVKAGEIQAPAFANDIRADYERGDLEVIHILNSESTHLMPDTVTRKLQQLPDLPVVSISMLPMAVREEDLERLEPHCMDPRTDNNPSDRLGCAAARISRHYLRKHLPQDKWVAAIERHGLKEYLLFVSAPHIEAKEE